MLCSILIALSLHSIVQAQDWDRVECETRVSWCNGNRTMPTAALPKSALCGAQVQAHCSDWCPKYGPYKACLEALRGPCFRFVGPNNFISQLDQACNRSEPFCTGCCASGVAKPVLKTQSDLTCTERSKFCNDAAARFGTTASCGACPKFSLIVACRSADERCRQEPNWEAVTRPTLNGCESIKSLCGDCCNVQNVSVSSECEGEPPYIFNGMGGPAATSGATPAVAPTGGVTPAVAPTGGATPASSTATATAADTASLKDSGTSAATTATHALAALVGAAVSMLMQ